MSLSVSSPNENIKVAVRVRPYNQDEISTPNKQTLLEMNGPLIRIITPPGLKDKSGDDHKFTFDSSLNSHDPNSPDFAGQAETFRVLGQPLVDSTIEGFNTCVLAYGQTGTGKTYTMMGGDGEEEGLIPRICKALFDRLDEDPSQPNKVEVSYFEIYNEQVYDLLSTPTVASSRMTNGGVAKEKGLRVREHKVLGPYIEGLTHLATADFAGIHKILAKGNTNRHTGATSMNAHSSRSHAVLSIAVHKATIPGTAEDDPVNISARMSLVDLAGSERQESTGATGAQLKEGSYINNALTTLGVVIFKLSKRKPGHQGKVHIPYRDSNLTWLLKDSIGGNARTSFIANVGPHASHFEETLATLRYVDHAKHIQNKPIINEDANSKLIRELQEHVAELEGQVKSAGLSDIAAQQSKAQLAQNQQLIEQLNQSWASKLSATAQALKDQAEVDAALVAKQEAYVRKVSYLNDKLASEIAAEDELRDESVQLKEQDTALETQLFAQNEKLVQLEESLGAEQAKTAALEAQVALMTQQMAELKANPVAEDPETAPAGTTAAHAANFLASDADLGEQLKFLLGRTTEDTRKFLDLAIFIQCSIESLKGNDEMGSDQDAPMIETMKQLEAALSRTLTCLTSGKVTAMAGYEQAPYFRKLPTDPSINKSARLRHLEFEKQDENATWTYMHAKPAGEAGVVSKRLMADV